MRLSRHAAPFRPKRDRSDVIGYNTEGCSRPYLSVVFSSGSNKDLPPCSETYAAYLGTEYFFFSLGVASLCAFGALLSIVQCIKFMRLQSADSFRVSLFGRTAAMFTCLTLFFLDPLNYDVFLSRSVHLAVGCLVVVFAISITASLTLLWTRKLCSLMDREYGLDDAEMAFQGFLFLFASVPILVQLIINIETWQFETATYALYSVFSLFILAFCVLNARHAYKAYTDLAASLGAKHGKTCQARRQLYNFALLSLVGKFFVLAFVASLANAAWKKDAFGKNESNGEIVQGIANTVKATILQLSLLLSGILVIFSFSDGAEQDWDTVKSFV